MFWRRHLHRLYHVVGFVTNGNHFDFSENRPIITVENIANVISLWLV